MRVLIIEDETRLAENIATALKEGAGYAVDVATDGLFGMHLLESADYDLVLLDLMLPKLSGEEILARMRLHDAVTPVLVLTAVTQVTSTINLLNKGADDYLTKPFDLGELLARSRALIRRGKGIKSTVLTLGILSLDVTKQVITIGDEAIDLSPTEYRILEYLMHRQRIVVSKQELLEHLYDFTWAHHSNVIEAHVSNLRRKLRASSSTVLLETMRGRGYRLASFGES